MGKPLLTLETLAPDRPTIAIDGTEYELAMPGEFSLRQEAENARILRKGTALLERAQKEAGETLEPKLEADVEELLGEVTAVILHAPPEVLGRLHWRQKLAVIQAFEQAVPSAATTPRNRPSRSTSASSRPGSRRRTGRATGSGSRRTSSSRS